MNQRWSLDELYISNESHELKSDIEKCKTEIQKITEWVKNSLGTYKESKNLIEEYLDMVNKFYHIFTRLYNYAELTVSVDATNEKGMSIVEELEQLLPELTIPQVAFQKWLKGVDNLSNIINQSPMLKEYEFYIKEIASKNKYLLNEEQEVLIAKMKNTGSNAWSKLQEMVTSTLLVDISIGGEEKKLPLPVVRNMAYEKHGELRKKAYEAELRAYKKIEMTSAACLNGIKGEVITIAALRGYKSPLEKTLIDSRMDKESLDAMLAAMKESLPIFHKYFKKKAQLLGYSEGLPFYDMFAPMGEADMKFTYDEARAYIVKNFRSFSNKLADFADRAFENRWIDAEPREGKRGGAFCANLHVIKESRIMSNFTGSFSDVVTLAHELGHGYHGDCLVSEGYLNSDYPMPIAETASIFCETIIKNAALKEATKEEAFAILEGSISDYAQVIVDIYSRYLFETELFERRKSGSVSVNELKDIMLKAQKEAYGDGLSHNALHPYMWVCKSHYYYADYNFYNFPYAFGLLFAKGLYSEYMRQGQVFVEEYDKLLAVTGKNNIADITKLMGIDIHSVEFWRSSLKEIEKDINEFIKL